jgi:hypothetical protein
MGSIKIPGLPALVPANALALESALFPAVSLLRRWQALT